MGPTFPEGCRVELQIARSWKDQRKQHWAGLPGSLGSGHGEPSGPQNCMVALGHGETLGHLKPDSDVVIYPLPLIVLDSLDQ